MDEPKSEITKDFYIPDYILVPGSEVPEASHEPTCPVLVFINSKSGGQLGGELLITYRSLLNENQVVDLTEKKPDRVLSELYRNLETLRRAGDNLAAQIEQQLRIIVAGGDGTACWLLGVISDLKLPYPPPIATVPLGTGNNLPFSFGWGKKNPSTNCQSAESYLEKVRTAKEMKVDSWHIIMRMKAPEEGPCEPIAPLELPHALHAFHRVSEQDSMNMEGCHTYRGGFWNYFSMGMDAQVSYAFHEERKINPEKFQNQIVNQSTYMKLAGAQGIASLVQPASKNLAQLAKVKVMNKHGNWEDLDVPRSTKSIICLNLPSFSGGLNPWGEPRRKYLKKGFTPMFVDDGLIEVIGFRDTFHGFILLAPNGHGTRLAQTSRVRFEFHKGAADHTYMRIDGEPWKQPLPSDDDTVVVEISHFGQVGMLATPCCRSKSVHDLSSPSVGHYDEGSNGDAESIEEEERRKFGAAETFKIPDEIDIAHFS